MSDEYISIVSANMVAYALSRLRTELGTSDINNDDFELTHSGTQEDNTHDITCVYDLSNENILIRIYVSPADGGHSVGNLRHANPDDTHDNVYTLYMGLPRDLFLESGQYACPDLIPRFEDLRALLLNTDIMSALLTEDSNDGDTSSPILFE